VAVADSVMERGQMEGVAAAVVVNMQEQRMQ
jgi:hypothetical protein